MAILLPPLHVVLGAGQVGLHVARALLARGLRVRMVRRGAFTDVPAGAETFTADVGDADAAANAIGGADVAYHCVNPPYTDWPRELPRLVTGILAGCARAHAKLVVLDNLYVFGDTAHMTEDTPMAPRSKKGVLRVHGTEQFLAAHAAGDVVTTIGRAADFFGPGATNALFGDRFYQRILSGRSGECLGDPDMVHSYSYTPDVAAGLVALGTDARADGKTWMLPVPPAESTRAVVARMARELGRELTLDALPGWVLALAGVFSRPMRELREMTYQWKQPFVLDDSRFRATFGAAATPWDDAVRATMTWAKQHYVRA